MGIFLRKEKAVCPCCGRRIRRRHPSLREIASKALGLRYSPALNYVMLALLSIGVGFVSLLLAATGVEDALFRLYLGSPQLLFLNLLPPILLIFLFYFISKRAWVAFTFPSLFLLALSLVGFYKVQLRNDPFLASDFIYFREAGTILSSYSLTFGWKVILTIFAFVLGVLFSVFVLKHKPKHPPLVRAAAAVAVLAISASLYAFAYSSDKLYDNSGVKIRGTEWSAFRSYVSKGFLYPFIHSISNSLPGLPDWYNEKEALEILASYDGADIPDDKKVDIISLALEAYVDLSVFDALDFAIDLYAPLHRLQAESVSGTLVTNIFGGGTIDTERLVMTGNTHLTTYHSATNSFVQYLRSQGFYTEGLHAGDMWFYDRNQINPFLGFDKYYFIEDFENGSRTDSFFFSTVKGLYDSRDRDKPYFSFNLSYQNHGAYDTLRTKAPYYISQGNMTDESFNALNNYLSGIYDTTQRLEAFIDSLRSSAEPVVVLVFGDHKPWLGNDCSVYAELGINIDRDTEEGFFNYYTAPYFIWANDAAKGLLSSDFVGDGGSFSPCFLFGELFQLCSWEGEEYMQALRELMPVVDVINPVVGLFREGETLTPELSEEAQEAYMKLRMLEQYRLENFYY